MDQREEDHFAARNAPNDWRLPPKSQRVVDASGPAWLERTFGITSLAGRLGCFGSVAVVLVLPFIGIGFCSHQVSENARLAAEQKTKDDAIEAAADEAEYKEAVKTGAGCEDGPKGLNTAFELNVKRQLKDPDSFEHMGTVITPSKKGGYDALMRFRSRNSFGGFVVGTAVAKLYVAEHGVCEVRSLNVAG